MNFESNRLNTFSNWPTSAAVDPIRIAKAGFYYTGQGVEVQCFSCGGKISEWNYGDQVITRHRRLDSNCPFIVYPERSGNIPLELDQQCPIQESSLIDRVTDYGVTEEDEMYRSDALRLLSFVNWNDRSVSPESLVNAGFYHAGEGRIRCAWCGGELARSRRLRAMGEPLEIHLRFFPGCFWAEMLQARDIAAQAALASPGIVNSSTSTISPPASPASAQTDAAIHNARVLAGSGTWRSLGVIGGATGARHPDRASMASRLATYIDWPRHSTQPSEEMAEAGFYYTGSDDQVRCFYCDGGLGKWESGDTPWREHAKWFPHCGFILLVKGREFVDSCKETAAITRTRSADVGLTTRTINSENIVTFPVSEARIQEQMESATSSAALLAGLDAARVRRAVVRRMRTTGLPFSSSEALIDAVLNEQLNEEAWSVSPQSQRFARDILAETLRELSPNNSSASTTNWDERSDSQQSHTDTPPMSLTVNSQRLPTPEPIKEKKEVKMNESNMKIVKENIKLTPEKKLSLEEENRQLKEARLCKVCMDGEVSVVFLPCGHLVSCASCGAGLGACPLCRARVHALVRAYLA